MEIADASVFGLAEYGKSVRSVSIEKVEILRCNIGEWEREIDSIIPIRHVKGAESARRPRAIADHGKLGDMDEVVTRHP